MQAKLQKAAQIISVTNVPRIPDEIIRLKEELNKTYPNTVTVANLISHNPELLGNFLSLVNTNVTNEKTEIKDAKAAVNVLGLDEIYNIFLASSLTNLIAQSTLEKQILMHGAQAGLAAAELSYWVPNVTRAEAYISGLMQNVGAVYLSRQSPEAYEKLFQTHLSKPITAIDEEQAFFDTTHLHLGIFIAKKWNIDHNVYKSILMHHDPEFIQKTGNDDKVRNLIAIIMVANFAVASANHEQYMTQELKNYRDLGLSTLNLPDNAMKAAISAVQKWGKSPTKTPGGH
ncbi:MAG: HDOD domain-containing protein [Thiotrichales bacterium]|nr:HDOD domain-containing protein [Thiotrichales bacterium]